MSLSVYAMNGKSVQIDNTDAEGRLILAGEPRSNTPSNHKLNANIDALYYGTTAYKPHSVVDVATLTGLVAHKSTIDLFLTRGLEQRDDDRSR